MKPLRPSPPSAQAAREVRRDSPMRQARTCYSHLAGVAGVRVLDEMLRRGWLDSQAGPRPLYRLTPLGSRALAERGVEIPPARGSRRICAYGCLDWTERRPHLAGELGAAIRRGLEGAGVIRRVRTSRVVTLITPMLRWLEEPRRSFG